jgi:hypothetical protein
LLPVFLLAAGTLKRRAAFLGSFLGAIAVLALPWVITLPQLIATKVFVYSPVQGWWGFLYLLPGSGAIFRIAVFVSIAAAAAYMHQRVHSVFVQCGIVAFIFLFLTPGFGPQYLAWVLPWTVAAGLFPAVLFQLAAGFYCFAIYTAWSAHIPWYFANAHLNPIPEWVLRAGLIAWAALPLLVFDAYRADRRRSLSLNANFTSLPAGANSSSLSSAEVVGYDF